MIHIFFQIPRNFCFNFLVIISFFETESFNQDFEENEKAGLTDTNQKTSHCICLQALQYYLLSWCKCPRTFSKAKFVEGECQKSETCSHLNLRAIFACWQILMHQFWDGNIIYTIKKKNFLLSVGKCPYIRRIIPSIVRGIFLMTHTVFFCFPLDRPGKIPSAGMGIFSVYRVGMGKSVV